MRYDKHHRQDKLTIEQAVQCLEADNIIIEQSE